MLRDVKEERGASGRGQRKLGEGTVLRDRKEGLGKLLGSGAGEKSGHRGKTLG